MSEREEEREGARWEVLPEEVIPAALSTPNFYLDRAGALLPSVRAWIVAYVKRHPEDPDLEEGPGAAWVLEVLRDVEKQLVRAAQSVDRYLPTAGTKGEGGG